MNKIVYRVYSDSTETAGSTSTVVESVTQALQQFPLDVEALLGEFDANVACESPTKDANSIVAVIESSATEEQVGEAVATCLSRHGLCGAKLQRV